MRDFCPGKWERHPQGALKNGKIFEIEKWIEKLKNYGKIEKLKFIIIYKKLNNLIYTKK